MFIYIYIICDRSIIYNMLLLLKPELKPLINKAKTILQQLTYTLGLYYSKSYMLLHSKPDLFSLGCKIISQVMKYT